MRTFVLFFGKLHTELLPRVMAELMVTLSASIKVALIRFSLIPFKNKLNEIKLRPFLILNKCVCACISLIQFT